MIIEIKDTNGNGSLELCICEFQGEVEGELPGNELGKIIISEGGKAFMNIGLHLLEGNVVDLKLPFLAIEKKKELCVKDSIDGISQAVPYSDSNLEIIGVVRKKIIFKTRPKPTCTVHRN